MTRRRTSLMRAVAGVAVLALAAACGGGNGGGSSSDAKPIAAGTGTLTVVPTVGGAADSWNPMTGNSGLMNLNVYATLLAVGKDGELTGYLAKDFTSTPTDVSFTLKDGITCSDGTELTATDVKSSLDYFFASGVTTKTSSFGPGPYTVTADDAANTVKVTLGTPFQDAPWGFSDFFPGKRTAIICPEGIKALKADPTALDTADTTYGTGPYTVAEATPGGDVTLKLRPDFAWGPDGMTAKTPGVPGEIKYVIQPNMSTRANLVKSGDINLSMISGPDVGRLTSDKSLQHTQLTARGVNPMYINQTAGHPRGGHRGPPGADHGHRSGEVPDRTGAAGYSEHIDRHTGRAVLRPGHQGPSTHAQRRGRDPDPGGRRMGHAGRGPDQGRQEADLGLPGAVRLRLRR